MSLRMFVFLLVVCLLLSLARLGRLCWFHLRPSSARGAAKGSRLHRLLKPRCPDDCPACRLASPASSAVEPASAPVRPWHEVKSRRGAPKQVTPRASPVRTSSVRTLASLMLESMLWWEMVSMVVPSKSRRFVVKPAEPGSALDAVHRYTG